MPKDDEKNKDTEKMIDSSVPEKFGIVPTAKYEPSSKKKG